MDIDLIADVQLEQDTIEIGQMIDCCEAVATLGSSPTALAILQRRGFLNNTALSSVGLEYFSNDTSDGIETNLAVESLMSNINERVASYAAKIVHFFKTGFTQIGEKLTSAKNAITSVVSELADASWDKLKETGEFAKAHPYKTAALIVGSITAVAGIAMMIQSGFPKAGASKETLSVFVKKVKNACDLIKSPFGKVETSLSPLTPNGPEVKLLTYIPKSNTDVWGHALPDMSPSFGTWTKEGVKKIGTELTKSLGTIVTFFRDGLAAHYQFAGEIGRFAGKHSGGFLNGMMAGAVATAMVAYFHVATLYLLLMALTRLIVHVVLRGVHSIQGALSKLRAHQ